MVLVVDEAQNLSPELLEQVRLLTNLETDTQKLLQIILIGQPELRDLLARNDLRQLAQRVTGRYHLDPLSRSESAAYVKHRLRIAGATADIFTGSALAELYRGSGGVPRLLNIISDRALLGGYTEDRHEITAAMVRRAASEVFDRRMTPHWLPWVLGAATLVVVAGGALAAWSLYQRAHDATPLPETVAATMPAAVVAQPPPAAPAPAPAPADLATVLRDSAALTGLDGAYSKLFALWSARYMPGSEDACSQALRQGLECLNEEGGFEVLRRFNRPAILPVSDANGTIHQVVVTKLAQQTAQLMIGDSYARSGAGRPGAALARGFPAAVEAAAAGYAQPLHEHAGRTHWRAAQPAAPVGRIDAGNRAQRSVRRFAGDAGQAVPVAQWPGGRWCGWHPDTGRARLRRWPPSTRHCSAP